MKCVIAVAMHKPYRVCADALYLPVHAGAQGKPDAGFAACRDDAGTHISEKNAAYCELTVLYWLWKNRAAEYDAAGLCHYRRYFALRRFGSKWDRILTGDRLQRVLAKGADAVLPKKRHYWIESSYSQYVHAHHEIDLTLTRDILTEKYGERYTQAFDRVMKRTSGHRFNMLVMRKPLLDRYCAFLFDVLGTLEERLDISGYSAYDARVFGFVGERLLDVYLEAEPFTFVELPVVNLESQHWPRKIANFLRRKLRGKP